MRGVVVAGLLVIAMPAIADDATRAPGFVVLPGFDATSRLGLDATDVLLRVGGVNYADLAFHVQYVVPDLGAGAYLRYQQPVSGPALSGPSSGNQLGIVYAVQGSPLEAPDIRAVLHGGITGGPPLPYEMRSGTSVAGDAGVSVLGRGRDLYGRIDLDVELSGSTIASGELDAGIGYDVGGVAIGAEAMWSNSEHVAPPGVAQPTLEQLLGAVSARYVGFELQPYVAAMSTFDARIIGAVVGVEYRR